jgi:hypothetical protein
LQSLYRAVAADHGPPDQPNKASSAYERLPDQRAIVAATTLQSLAKVAACLTSAAASLEVGDQEFPRCLIINGDTELRLAILFWFERNAPRSAVTGITARKQKGRQGRVGY